MASDRLDIVIFGATGYTGKNAVKKAACLAKDKQFTIGIAGRRKEALESVLKEYAPKMEGVRVIIADLKDEESLKKMTEQAKVLVNCCGPYRFYGEPIIKACIATHTHHVDVSGEPQYMEKMQLLYDKPAQEAGIYIVSACGFDSIPADLGVIFTQNKFEGEVNSVETYLQVSTPPNFKGPKLNYGTWESAVYGLAHQNELSELRRKLYPSKLPELKPRLKTKRYLHSSAIADGWSMLFLGSDRAVCLRTQRFLFEKYKQRPAQVQTYITFKNLINIVSVLIFGGLFILLTKFEFGRNLLLKHPRFFSGGAVSRDGPLPEFLEDTHFSVTLVAKGWSEKLADPSDQHKEPPNKELITKVSAANPGYGATCTALLVSAFMILNESEKIPGNGGVLPPGAAFGKTSMIEQLCKYGFKFEVISSIEK